VIGLPGRDGGDPDRWATVAENIADAIAARVATKLAERVEPEITRTIDLLRANVDEQSAELSRLREAASEELARLATQIGNLRGTLDLLNRAQEDLNRTTAGLPERHAQAITAASAALESTVSTQAERLSRAVDVDAAVERFQNTFDANLRGAETRLDPRPSINGLVNAMDQQVERARESLDVGPALERVRLEIDERFDRLTLLAEASRAQSDRLRLDQRLADLARDLDQVVGALGSVASGEAALRAIPDEEAREEAEAHREETVLALSRRLAALAAAARSPLADAAVSEAGTIPGADS
jgi:hypothetical protein